jgi:hypothetical protein
MAGRTTAKAKPYTGVKFSTKYVVNCRGCGAQCADKPTRETHERFCPDYAAIVAEIRNSVAFIRDDVGNFYALLSKNAPTADQTKPRP